MRWMSGMPLRKERVRRTDLKGFNSVTRSHAFAIRQDMTSARWHLALLLTFLLILAWSGFRPLDRFVWFLEVFPAIIGAMVLLALYPRVKLTMLVYCLIWLHALVLILGGHWTYAEMPLFSWLRDEFGLSRNYYDRVGHVMQGAVPAIIAREILLRNGVVNGRGWLFFLVT